MTFSTCLVVFLALLLASIALQWARAVNRKRLVASCDRGLLGSDEQSAWHDIDAGLDFMFRDFRKLRIIRRNLGAFDDGYRTMWVAYRRLSRLEMTVTTSMLAFGALAFLFCR